MQTVRTQTDQPQLAAANGRVEGERTLATTDPAEMRANDEAKPGASLLLPPSLSATTKLRRSLFRQ